MEITDPTITVLDVDGNGDPIIKNINKSDMTITIELRLQSGEDIVDLNEFIVPVLNLEYTTAKNVMDRILDRLADFKV